MTADKMPLRIKGILWMLGVETAIILATTILFWSTNSSFTNTVNIIGLGVPLVAFISMLRRTDRARKLTRMVGVIFIIAPLTCAAAYIHTRHNFFGYALSNGGCTLLGFMLFGWLAEPDAIEYFKKARHNDQTGC